MLTFNEQALKDAETAISSDLIHPAIKGLIGRLVSMYEESKAVNVGLINENTHLKRRLQNDSTDA